ncbi:hypothetical protein [uncultured Nostoc sp.]|uniref:hypothetical protein n=1 Tax=uncultured Nostoc sp. TaxID=340711 RepID=UPI00261309B2|nr:hypothetical protein [uncultured Nostoc sp.]
MGSNALDNFLRILFYQYRKKETTSWREITTNPPAEFIDREEFTQPCVVDIDRLVQQVRTIATLRQNSRPVRDFAVIGR